MTARTAGDEAQEGWLDGTSSTVPRPTPSANAQAECLDPASARTHPKSAWDLPGQHRLADRHEETCGSTRHVLPKEAGSATQDGPMQNTISTIDLFAGAGGLSLGFEHAAVGFMPVFAVELEPAAARTFKGHFGCPVYDGSIEDVRSSRRPTSSSAAPRARDSARSAGTVTTQPGATERAVAALPPCRPPGPSRGRS